MNGHTGSSLSLRSTYVEQGILDEAWTNLALLQRQEVYAYSIRDCTDRQDILERWVLSQQRLYFIDCELTRLVWTIHSLRGKAWRDGYNSPSALRLMSISENLEPESSRNQFTGLNRTTTTTRGRGGYNKR